MVGSSESRDNFRSVLAPPRQTATTIVNSSPSSIAPKRSVLVFGNRLLETLVYLVVGLILLVLGLLSTNVNYQVLFFILTAFFIFAIFRPTSQP
jgi:hypothetical protein